MILYGSTMSPFVRKVAAFATEKGIDYELRATSLNDPDPEFRAASPFGKKPRSSAGRALRPKSSGKRLSWSGSRPDKKGRAHRTRPILASPPGLIFLWARPGRPC